MTNTEHLLMCIRAAEAERERFVQFQTDDISYNLSLNTLERVLNNYIDDRIRFMLRQSGVLDRVYND